VREIAWGLGTRGVDTLNVGDGRQGRRHGFSFRVRMARVMAASMMMTHKA
jgi:hypothetical protein